MVCSAATVLCGLDNVQTVFGKTVNPHHAELTPGGSSGGEGALLAMKGCE